MILTYNQLVTTVFFNDLPLFQDTVRKSVLKCPKLLESHVTPGLYASKRSDSSPGPLHAT